MKYILIIPWLLFLATGATIVSLIALVARFLWDFKLTIPVSLQEYETSWADMHLSPFHPSFENYYNGRRYYKTYYHYLLNIQK